MISFRSSASAEQRGFDGEVPRFSKAWAGGCRGVLGVDQTEFGVGAASHDLLTYSKCPLAIRGKEDSDERRSALLEAPHPRAVDKPISIIVAIYVKRLERKNGGIEHDVIAIGKL